MRNLQFTAVFFIAYAGPTHARAAGHIFEDESRGLGGIVGHGHHGYMFVKWKFLAGRGKQIGFFVFQYRLPYFGTFALRNCFSGGVLDFKGVRRDKRKMRTHRRAAVGFHTQPDFYFGRVRLAGW